MSYHRDREVNKAMIRLLDTLCTWERETGRGSKLLLVPDADDERLVFAMDGKPIHYIDSLSLGVQLDQIKSKVFRKSRGSS